MKSLFTLDGGIYLPTPWAVGPWDPNLIHGSSTAALFAYGFEAQLPGAEWLLARLSIDIFRPVAVAPTSLRGEVVRMTYTERGDDVHVISLRRATRHEIERLAKGLSR